LATGVLNIDKRAGVYMNGSRRGAGMLERGVTHTIRLGLSNVDLRVACGAELDPLPQAQVTSAHPPGLTSVDTVDVRVPSPPAVAVLDVGGVLLEPDERQFLSTLVLNKQLKTSDLCRLLNRSPIRVNGMVRALKRKLHEIGAPVMFSETNRDGESHFEILGSRS
jgi:hypothetical protein